MLLHLLNDPKAYQILTEEIRTTFARYEDIRADALPRLEYLTACLEESLRLFPNNNGGLPRVSPGANVDGHFFPKGVCSPLVLVPCSQSHLIEYPYSPLTIATQGILPNEHLCLCTKFQELS